MSGESTERRWLWYNGGWRTFNLRPSDPQYADSVEYTGPDSDPGKAVVREAPKDEVQAENKAVTTRQGQRGRRK